ncbi:uncharacterized protein EV422DRAFT_581666 [Fimicolochytrium jonesii]|uniref:uncharacterized protein n=1 Tax=Fimicolochytrium jonesii TaxID=1396493 RepID=UPI0022FE2AA8|nr:uncharacterized protein EV422DRAFT_581666 [Fimicolochytrium jonesii]KAI8816186.1 hypothetical protein EV422DRAFT_581666 [Fimicolochytrium jonesii]
MSTPSLPSDLDFALDLNSTATTPPEPEPTLKETQLPTHSFDFTDLNDATAEEAVADEHQRQQKELDREVMPTIEQHAPLKGLPHSTHAHVEFHSGEGWDAKADEPLCLADLSWSQIAWDKVSSDGNGDVHTHSEEEPAQHPTHPTMSDPAPPPTATSTPKPPINHTLLPTTSLNRASFRPSPTSPVSPISISNGSVRLHVASYDSWPRSETQVRRGRGRVSRYIRPVEPHEDATTPAGRETEVETEETRQEEGDRFHRTTTTAQTSLTSLIRTYAELDLRKNVDAFERWKRSKSPKKECRAGRSGHAGSVGAEQDSFAIVNLEEEITPIERNQRAFKAWLHQKNADKPPLPHLPTHPPQEEDEDSESHRQEAVKSARIQAHISAWLQTKKAQRIQSRVQVAKQHKLREEEDAKRREKGRRAWEAWREGVDGRKQHAGEEWEGKERPEWVDVDMDSGEVKPTEPVRWSGYITTTTSATKKTKIKTHNAPAELLSPPHLYTPHASSPAYAHKYHLLIASASLPPPVDDEEARTRARGVEEGVRRGLGGAGVYGAYMVGLGRMGGERRPWYPPGTVGKGMRV